MKEHATQHIHILKWSATCFATNAFIFPSCKYQKYSQQERQIKQSKIMKDFKLFFIWFICLTIFQTNCWMLLNSEPRFSSWRRASVTCVAKKNIELKKKKITRSSKSKQRNEKVKKGEKNSSNFQELPPFLLFQITPFVHPVYHPSSQCAVWDAS